MDKVKVFLSRMSAIKKHKYSGFSVGAPFVNFSFVLAIIVSALII